MAAPTVVKIGGAAGIDAGGVVEDLARLFGAGRRFVLMHGGSDEATRLGEALGHPPRFVTSPSGHTSRYTDARTLEIFMMATALVNRRLVAALRRLGVPALGLSGIDAGLLRAERKAAVRDVTDGRVRILRDDHTGRPRSCDTALLRDLIARPVLPVLAPLAAGERGEPLNVDGDRAAATIAAALAAERLVILSNVPGVLERFPDERSLVRRAGPGDLEQLASCAKGRMRKKVLAAGEALAGGVGEVVIGDARVERPLEQAQAGAGTVIAGAAAGGARREGAAG